MKIIADRYCPTWSHSHEGWRARLIAYGLPSKWFKKTKQERVVYLVGDTVVCSYETKAEMDKLPLVFDPTMPSGRVEFWSAKKIIGVIENLKGPPGHK